MNDLVLVILCVLVLLVWFGLARLAWRHFVGNEEMQSGGSLGNQMFGRRNKS